MAKKTLSQKTLGAGFAKQIELREFGDMARLTDEELRLFASRSFKNISLAYALSAGDPDTETLRTRILGTLSGEDREVLQINLDHIEKYRTPFSEYQQDVLAAARQLQREGAIRPAPKRRLPKGTVEIERFADLVRLTDYEIQQLLRNVDTVHLAAALAGKKDHTGPEHLDLAEVEERLMSNVSERVGRFIRLERRRLKASKRDALARQGHIVQIARSLQAQGTIRPGSSPMTAPRVDIRSFDDLVKLTDFEIQTMLREIDTRDVAVALKGTAKGMEDVAWRVKMNYSDRINKMIRTEMDAIQPSAEEIDARQQKILNTVRNLQTLGRIRFPSRKPTRRQYERVVAEAAQDQIEQGRHGGWWTPRAFTYLLPYLALQVRDGEPDGVRETFKGIQDPVFARGTRLLAEGVEQEEMVRQLREAARQEVQRMEGVYRRLIVGLAAVQDGEDPRDIGDRLAGL